MGPIDDRAAVGIDPMNLHNVLRDIHTNNRLLHDQPTVRREDSYDPPNPPPFSAAGGESTAAAYVSLGWGPFISFNSNRCRLAGRCFRIDGLDARYVAHAFQSFAYAIA